MELRYETRDGEGNDIVKMVQIKEYEAKDTEFDCPICKGHFEKGIPAKKIVSASFVDWAFIGPYICEDCAKLFSLYPYSYIACPEGIRLLNVRQLKGELVRQQPTPFRFIITTTQKKHLFYRSVVNNGNGRFGVNLETEIIYTSHQRMEALFTFVESLLALGAGKKQMQEGQISFAALQKTGFAPLRYLQKELKSSREIQIPLYCGQKLNISEEEAICNLDLILKA